MPTQVLKQSSDASGKNYKKGKYQALLIDLVRSKKTFQKMETVIKHRKKMIAVLMLLFIGVSCMFAGEYMRSEPNGESRMYSSK